MAEVLVVDDDEVLQDMLVGLLQHSGHQASSVSTLTDGLKQASTGTYDVIFLDVQLPDGDGLIHLPEFKAVASAPEVIIITGKGDQDGAEKAILSGAWAYIKKPNVIHDLLLHLTRALQYRKEKNKVYRIPVVLKRDNIIGNSPQLQECLDQVAQAASSDASVLITGETGTGKELIARAIHDNSKRASHDFVIVDCAALPESLIESILFGHVKGAFTGADKNRKGLISLGDKGTLFLDEVGELPLNIQKTFLRVLQEQSYRPVGASREEHSDFRIVAATNRNVEKCVEQGAFRSDLMYRLQAFSLELSPLRERKGDVKLLTKHFLTRLCDRSKIQYKMIAPDFFEHLAAYDWPGNVRELQQTLEQVFAATVQTSTLFATHLPNHFRIRQAQAGVQSLSDNSSAVQPSIKSEGLTLPLWQEYKNDFEKKYICDLMRYSKDNVKLACKVSGLSRARLYQLRNKYGLIPSS